MLHYCSVATTVVSHYAQQIWCQPVYGGQYCLLVWSDGGQEIRVENLVRRYLTREKSKKITKNNINCHSRCS